MEAPDAAVGAPADGSVAISPMDQARPSTPADPVSNVPLHASAPGDRILANLSGSPVRAPAEAGPPVTERPGAKPSIDIGRPMDTIELQLEVARVTATTGLAISATQKSSQGVDTLLKSQ